MSITKSPTARSLNSFATKSYLRVSNFARNHSLVILPALVFFAVILAMNWRVFVIPEIESGDIAANALQVQNAEHLTELLGNYSRWHFHHPGPFFFYLFGAGELVLYDFLHLVPAPINGEVLAEITFSVTCLFLSIYVFYGHVNRPLFPALAVFASVLFLFVVDSALPSSALVSLWPPYMSIFCFLLFATASASVASGQWKHVILMAASGMIMVHSHVAQLLFISTLGGAALSTAVFREFRCGNPAATFLSHRKYFFTALGVVVLFTLPILIDSMLDSPTNIHQIRAYLQEHRGEHNSLATSLLYWSSFFTFFVKPEIILTSPTANLKDLLNPDWYVQVYWTIFFLIAFFSVTSLIGRTRKIPTFIGFVFAEVVFISVVFVYWSWRITGPMYTFNGYFYFSVQLLALLGFSSLAVAGTELRIGRNIQLATACSLTALLLLVGGVRHEISLDQDIHLIFQNLWSRQPKNVALVMQSQTWPVAAGVASLLERTGIQFCVEPQWGFVFGKARTCTANGRNYRVTLSEKKPICRNPCSLIYNGSNLYVTGAPNPSFLKLPIDVMLNDSTIESESFNGLESNGAWSTKQSSLYFYLSNTADTGSHSYLLQLLGTLLPGRPVTVKLNDAPVGVMNSVGRHSQAFKVSSAQLNWGKRNAVTFDVPNAGPVGPDNRQLGYFLEELLIRESGDSMNVDKLLSSERQLSGTLLDLTWSTAGGWTVGGYYPGIGNLDSGIAWGSWNHNDASTGKLSSSTFSTRTAGCVVVPVGHGPSVLGQEVSIVSANGTTLAQIPLEPDDGKWEFYSVTFNRQISKIKIVAEDLGSGFGEWVAVGQPRSCGG